jgi:hypothetical protein
MADVDGQSPVMWGLELPMIMDTIIDCLLDEVEVAYRHRVGIARELAVINPYPLNDHCVLEVEWSLMELCNSNCRCLEFLRQGVWEDAHPKDYNGVYGFLA